MTPNLEKILFAQLLIWSFTMFIPLNLSPSLLYSFKTELSSFFIKIMSLSELLALLVEPNLS